MTSQNALYLQYSFNFGILVCLAFDRLAQWG